MQIGIYRIVRAVLDTFFEVIQFQGEVYLSCILYKCFTIHTNISRSGVLISEARATYSMGSIYRYATGPCVALAPLVPPGRSSYSIG